MAEMLTTPVKGSRKKDEEELDEFMAGQDEDGEHELDEARYDDAAMGMPPATPDTPAQAHDPEFMRFQDLTLFREDISPLSRDDVESGIITDIKRLGVEPELIQARRADECHALCPYTRRVCDMNASRVCARFRFAF